LRFSSIGDSYDNFDEKDYEGSIFIRTRSQQSFHPRYYEGYEKFKSNEQLMAEVVIPPRIKRGQVNIRANECDDTCKSCLSIEYIFIINLIKPN
jgi:hypothetical protein